MFFWGAYDTKSCYKSSEKNRLNLITPPKKNAVYNHIALPYMQKRNEAILEILGLGGDDHARKLWKKLTGYHKKFRLQQ